MSIITTETLPVAVDIGNGNVKTPNYVFKSGVDTYNDEPTLSADFFQYDRKYHVVGERRMIYTADKTTTEDCRILTIAGILREMDEIGVKDLYAHLAVGLPLGWCSKVQKNELISYYMDKADMDVIWHSQLYTIHLSSVNVYPQSFAAACLYDVSGNTMIADIGNGTLSTMLIIDGKPIENSIATDRIGVGKALDEIKHEIAKREGYEVDDNLVEPMLIKGVGYENPYYTIISDIAVKYAQSIISTIKNNGFKSGLMKLYIFGGGGCLIKNFTNFGNTDGVHIVDDVCANAKGYLQLVSRKYAGK